MAVHSPYDDTSRWVVAFTELQSVVLVAADPQEYVARWVVLLSEVIGPDWSWGVTLQRGGRSIGAHSDARAEHLDEICRTARDGPTIEAHRTGVPVWADDPCHELRWHSFRAATRQLGLDSTLSLPIVVDDQSVGALSIHSPSAQHVFTAELRQQCLVFTRLATSTLSLFLQRLDEQRTHDQLEHALTSRAVIDQAIGIVMGQHRCTSTQAFAWLSRQSQLTNTKVRNVATRLVTDVAGRPAHLGGDQFRTATRRNRGAT